MHHRHHCRQQTTQVSVDFVYQSTEGFTVVSLGKHSGAEVNRSMGVGCQVPERVAKQVETDNPDLVNQA